MKILQRYTGAILFETASDSLVGADLYGANLRGADLYGANLSDADLRDADLRDAALYGAKRGNQTLTKTPLTIANLPWFVLITDTHMEIGCQTHTHGEWSAFDDDTIKRMDVRQALMFWRTWKTPLLAMCAAHKAGN